MDMRGHGNSSKILTGHTIPEYARDVRALIEHLDLQGAGLFGWSLAGQVVLSYWQQYSHDSRLKALGLVDINPAPFSQEAWNCHMLKDTTFDGMNTLNISRPPTPRAFAGIFAGKFRDTKPAANEFEWMVAELFKDAGMDRHRDSRRFPDPRLYPGAADDHRSHHRFRRRFPRIFPTGIMQGKYLADRIPGSRFVPFDTGGHLLFYDQAEKFNQVTADFIRSL